MLTATGLCLSDTVFSGYRSTPCDVVESALPQAEWVGEAAAVTGAAIAVAIAVTVTVTVLAIAILVVLLILAVAVGIGAGRTVHRRLLLIERHVHIHGLAVAHDGQRHLVSQSRGTNVTKQRVVVVHRVAVEGHDGVALLEAGLVGRAAGDDRAASGAGLGDGRAAAGHAVGFNRVGLDDHAEGNVLDLAVLDDFVGHTLDEVGRDGEADADRTGGVG